VNERLIQVKNNQTVHVRLREFEIDFLGLGHGREIPQSLDKIDTVENAQGHLTVV